MFASGFCTLPQMQRWLNFYFRSNYFEFNPQKGKIKYYTRLYTFQRREFPTKPTNHTFFITMEAYVEGF